jgi:DNA-binding NarL/FixJ family response regulator
MQLVGEVTDSESLMAALETAQADLLLLDWGMLGKQAAEMLTALRAQYPALKLIVMSGQLGVRRAALAAGADAFVSKGDPPDRLWTALKEVAGNAK